MLIRIFDSFFWVCIIVIFVACNTNKTKTNSYWTEPITKMEFVLIRKGSFYMGNPYWRSDSSNNEKQHFVTITHDFWLAKMEVTQEQWQKIMGNKELHPEKPSPLSCINSQYPIVSISYFDVQKFLQKLTNLSNGNRFRLPTEAEWEYACRAGTSTNFSTGTSISDTLSNFNASIPSDYSAIGKYLGHSTTVGSYPPNLWGLYDMHGNAWEWVSDWYAPYSSEHTIDPCGPKSSTLKIIRGGSWYFGATNARSYSRRTHEPGLWGFSIGFRVVCEKND